MQTVRRQIPIFAVAFLVLIATGLFVSSTTLAQAPAAAADQVSTWSMLSALTGALNFISVLVGGIVAYVLRSVKETVNDIRGEISGARADIEVVHENQQTAASWAQINVIALGHEVRRGQIVCLTRHREPAPGQPAVVEPFDVALPTFKPLDRNLRKGGQF